jgi:geranylgeranyl diphosphate synthase type II
VSGEYHPRVKPSEFSAESLERRLKVLLPAEDTFPHALHAAMRHAVFPGGARLRPRLLLAVAQSASPETAEIELALQAACAIELIHSAALVHDDLPCFDDAPMRRGRPSVHAKFGEAMAILAGDALVVRAFELLEETPPRLARRAIKIVGLIARAAGSREGLSGGQSLESAPSSSAKDPHGPPPELFDRYNAMKTAALFRLAAEAGAVAVGVADGARWGEVGTALGFAYRVAVDHFGHPGEPKQPVDGGAALARLRALLDRARAQARAVGGDARAVEALIDEAARRMPG